MRVTYGPFEEGTRRVSVKCKLPPALEYSISYDVKFEKDFQFVLGCKMHGFLPKKPVTGVREGRPDGWRVRIMFRRQGAMVKYYYHQYKTSQYGNRGKPIDRFFPFREDRWMSVSIHVSINENPSKATGFKYVYVYVYVDGELIERHDQVRLRARIHYSTTRSSAPFTAAILRNGRLATNGVIQ